MKKADTWHTSHICSLHPVILFLYPSGYISAWWYNPLLRVCPLSLTVAPLFCMDIAISVIPLHSATLLLPYAAAFKLYRSHCLEILRRQGTSSHLSACCKKHSRLPKAILRLPLRLAFPHLFFCQKKSLSCVSMWLGWYRQVVPLACQLVKKRKRKCLTASPLPFSSSLSSPSVLPA